MPAAHAKGTRPDKPTVARPPVMVHPTAMVERGARIGRGTQIWHQSHVRRTAIIGEACMIGYGCYIDATLGRGCRVQNHASIFAGVELRDEVFIGPGVMFSNVKRPRAMRPQRDAFVPTLVERGATLGAGVTVVCGVTIGAYAMVGAGATVTRDVPPHALVVGTPARVIGYVCACGQPAKARAPHVCAACAAVATATSSGRRATSKRGQRLGGRTVRVAATRR
ncbi:MAG: N-acetyltransferase [Myxococcales bacterium]|nr:N-acetyltransferase [Myxococcales bacterium]